MRIARFLRSRLAGYAAINALAAGATFLAVPVLIRQIGIDGFGTWSLIEPVIFFGAALALLGAEHGIMKDVAFKGEDVRDVLGQMLVCSAPTVTISGLAIGAVSWAFVSLDLAVLVAFLAVSEGFLAMATSAARAARHTTAFAVGQIGRTLGFLALLCGLLVTGQPAGIFGVLALRLALVALLVGVVLAMLRPRPCFNGGRYISALHYGAFILVSSLVTMVLEMADRYLVAAFASAASVGTYMVHVKIASIVGQGIVMPFSLWFAPERLRHMEDADGGSAFFDHVALGLTAICAVGAGGAFLTGPVLVDLLAPEVAFDPVAIGALLVSASLIGLTYALNIGLLRPGRTHLNIAPVVAGVAVMLITGPVLIALAGPAGASLARLAGTLVFLALLSWLSQRIYAVAFSYGAMVLLATGAASCIVLIHVTLPVDGLEDWKMALARLTLLICITAGLAAIALARPPALSLSWRRAK